MPFKLTFNKPAVDRFFSENSRFKLDLEGDQVILKPTSKGETAELERRERGGAEVYFLDDKFSDIETKIRHPHGVFNIIEEHPEKKGWLRFVPFTKGGAPDKFTPHARIWGINGRVRRDGTIAPPPKAAKTVRRESAPKLVEAAAPQPLTREALMAAIEEARALDAASRGKVGRAPNRVVAARELLKGLAEIAPQFLAPAARDETPAPAETAAPEAAAPTVPAPLAQENVVYIPVQGMPQLAGQPFSIIMLVPNTEAAQQAAPAAEPAAATAEATAAEAAPEPVANDTGKGTQLDPDDPEIKKMADRLKDNWGLTGERASQSEGDANRQFLPKRGETRTVVVEKRVRRRRGGA